MVRVATGVPAGTFKAGELGSRKLEKRTGISRGENTGIEQTRIYPPR